MTDGLPRRPWAQLGVLGLMGAVAVADVAVPSVQSNRPPALPDLLTGLTLMWCGADLLWALSARRTGVLLCAAGIAWFLPDLAVTGHQALDHGLAAMSLVHVPLIVIALLRSPRGQLSGAPTWLAVVVSAVAAATAVTGGHVVALTLTGVLLDAVLVLAWHRAGRPTTKSWAIFLTASLAYGVVLVAAPVLRLAGGVEWWLPTLYDACVCLSATALVGAGDWLQPTRSVDVGPGGLGQVDTLVAHAYGQPGAHAVVRVPELGWVDLQGHPADPAHLVALDDAIALWVTSSRASGHPPQRSTAPLESMLRECLTLAARNVRLRVQSAAWVEDLARLRERLVAVEDEERRSLVDRMRAGPLARLDSLHADLSQAGVPRDLVVGVERTDRALRAIALGLDPLGPTGSLDDALGALVDERPGSTSLIANPVVVATPAAHTLWFACAEALANATKHAPDASVVVTLAAVSGDVVLTVSDDGPGGADSEGSGLRGARDRVISTGGTFRVESGPAGTTLTVAVPADPDSRDDANQRHDPGTRNHVSRTGAATDVAHETSLLASSQPTRTEEP